MLSNTRTAGLLTAGLAIGGAATVWLSTIPTDHRCQVSPVGVQCQSRRGQHWPLTMGLGLAQLGAAVGMFLQRDDDDNPTNGDRSPSLTPSPADGGAGAALGGEYDWVKPLFSYPQTLIVGGMGSGKTTLTRWLAQQRQNLGYRVIVIDPHAELGAWAGLDVVGAGLNWEAVADCLESIIDDIATRYQDIATNPNPNLPKTLIVCEEMTGWSEEIDPKLITRFDNRLIGDIRKAGYAVIKLSHNDTLSTTGGRAGTKKTQENYIRLYLENTDDPTRPDGVKPAFKGTLIMPGGEPRPVKINPAWRPSSLGSSSGGERSQNPASEPLNPSQSIDLGNLAPYQVQALNLNKTLSVNGEGTEERITRLASEGLTQDQIIEQIWGVKKGGSEKYKTAREIVQKYLKGA